MSVSPLDSVIRSVSHIVSFNSSNFFRQLSSAKLSKITVPFAALLLTAIAAVLIESRKCFRTITDIPNDYFKNKRTLFGKIFYVVDGDTYKFYPMSQWERWFGLKKKIAKDDGIIVRIAAVDTPETPKYGNPGQKFGLEAKEYAKRILEGKDVTVQLLRKDQYNRVVGVVRYQDGFKFNIDISEQLLKEGLATVYRQGGAEYDNRLKIFDNLETEAIKSKKGMWVNGFEGADLPSEYKKELKENETDSSK